MEIVIIGAIIIAALLGYIFFAKHRKEAGRIASTCGNTPHPGGTLDPRAWHIGPTLWDGPHSPGMPEHPSLHPDGFAFDFPTDAASKVDYVTFNHGSLANMNQMLIKYRLEMDAGVEVLAVPEQDPNGRYRCQMTPYFQREGDDWSMVGKFEAYRWYHTAGHYLEVGEHEMVIPLDSGWTATQTSTMDSNPAGFKDAIDNTCCAGFVFGGNDVGIGHGGRATGRARLVVLKYAVE